MIANKIPTDAPITSLVLLISSIVSIPVVIYVVFTVWAESIARQLVATTAVLLLLMLSIVRQKYETLLLVLILFSQFAISLHSFDLAPPAKFQLFLNDIILLLLIVVAIERGQKIKIDTIGWLFLLFIGWLTVTIFFSIHPHQSMVFLLMQIKYFVIYILALSTKLTESLVRRILHMVIAVVLIQTLVVIAQLMHGGWLGLGILGESSALLSNASFVRGSLRVSGTIGAANGFAGYISMLLVFLLPFVMTRMTLMVNVAFVSGLIAIILPLSRAGWLSFLAGSLCVVFMMLRAHMVRFSRLMFITFLVLAMVAGGFAVYADRIMNRFEDPAAVSSAMGRLDQVSMAMNVIKKNKIVGIGPGITELFGAWNDNRRYIHKTAAEMDMPNQVHNGQLQVWLESGTPGFIIFLAIIGVIFISVFRYKKQQVKDADMVSLFAIGGIGAAVAVMVHISFGTEFNCKQIFLAFWIILGLARSSILPQKRNWPAQ